MYSTPITRLRPTAFIIAIDRSGSMAEPITFNGERMAKSEAVALVANNLIDELINRAREDMERAAKSLDFLAAAKFRDRMYELQKLREENRQR